MWFTPSLAFALMHGLLLGLIFQLFRSAIDQRKGAVCETIVVTAPLLAAAPVLFWLRGNAGLIGFGMSLSWLLQITVLALPAFLLARLIERLNRRESLNVSDLFRLTTVVSVGVFGMTGLPTDVDIGGLYLAIAFYFAAEYAVSSSRPERGLAIVLSLGLLLSVLWTGVTRSSFFTSYWHQGRLIELPGLGPSGLFQMLVGTLSMICLVTVVGPWLVSRSYWFQEFAVRLHAWRISVGKAEDLMHELPWISLWQFRRGVCYLNHGSFGAVPLWVSLRAQRVRLMCQEEPQDFLLRQLEKRWEQARLRLAAWVGSAVENLQFCENATAAMNELAAWFPLRPGDQVLINDHEYGAVRRIWRRACERHGAELKEVRLPCSPANSQQISEAILGGCTERTRLVILSHITSPTAMRLPVEAVCSELQQRGIASCIDGPHALLQECFRLNRIKCDFYTASCHKWLCAPIGSGFIYVAPQWHKLVEPARLSWGRLLPNAPEHWTDELQWTGTRDPTAYLSVMDAIRFFERFDWKRVDDRNHRLACYARERLSGLPGCAALTPEGREWFGWMVAVWLPPGDHSQLQQRLWESEGIEVPVSCFGGRYLIRVSCHLYVTSHDIDLLARSLREQLANR